MTRGFPTVTPFLLLFLMGFALAGIHLWPSMHIALSNASVFVDYSADGNFTDHKLVLSLVDIDGNVTVLTRSLPFNQSEGSLEFNCSYFLYAGNFRFRLEQKHKQALSNRTAIWWWSPLLRVHWPTFHLAIDRGNNNKSADFRIGVHTNDHFHPCPDGKASSLFLDVSYMEQVQIGRNTTDKVQNQIRHNIKVVRSQHVDMVCSSPLTERGFIQISIKSPHTQQDIKSSGPLYLSSIFSYKLLVDNIYKSDCVGTVSVRRISPPCTASSGKVLLYREEGEEKPASTHLAFHFLTREENETEFNCSLFDTGRNKYCFHFTLIYSKASSLAHTCVVVQRHTKMWGPWQPWSACSVSCGEGVRERARECLLPSGGGGMQCTGMVREQSHCSFEDCTGNEEIPPPSVPPPPAVSFPLGGNLVVVAGISLCLAVILATIFITLWRKLCRAPKCSSMRRGSMHSPGGRKNSDEASICGHSLQRPSFSDSVQAAPLQKGLTLPAKQGPSDRGVLARQQSMSLPLPQDPERMSPSGQKIVPPIFGYRLAQQQLKEMKKKGLKETTQVYHVSQSPVDDAMLEATAPSPASLTPAPLEIDSPEETSSSHFHIKSPFLEPTWPPKHTGAISERHKVDMLPGPTKSAFSASSRRLERTADWVEMVERSKVTYPKNPNFRRTSSFHDSNQQQFPPSRPYRERSMTQVTPRQLPEGSCQNKTWAHTLPELEVWSCPNPRMTDRSGDQRRRPWVDTPPSQTNSLMVPKSAPVTPTKEASVDRHRIGRSPSSAMERAEQNWSRRGPSPIQRNILARKLREANSSTCQRQRSSTFSTSEQRRGRCRSLPLSADYSSSPYSLTQSEQQMMDISGYLGEEDGVEVLDVHRLT